jgi:hypothetical protein
MKSFILILAMVLCVSCTTKNTNGEPKLNAMEKFFDCLGDSSKCKELKKLND